MIHKIAQSQIWEKYLQPVWFLVDHKIAFIANGILRKPKVLLGFSMAIRVETKLRTTDHEILDSTICNKYRKET